MREITTHKVDGVADGISVRAELELGPGGAPHHYEIELPSDRLIHGDDPLVDIFFQRGGIVEAGVNGLTHEILLALVIDRLECFQRGPFCCAENGIALEYTRMALQQLQERTKKRLARGVEGQSKV